jgi:hypothetical protein
MASAGIIIALDLGVRMGAAIGPAGSAPVAVSVELKRSNQPRAVAFANLVAWLDGRIRDHRPALIFREKMLPLQAFKKLGNAEATIRMQAGLHAIVEGICGRYGIRCEEKADSTIRCHFLGIARMGDRKSTKAAVVRRCHLLELLPRSCSDDNMADAIAAFDFASATFMRRPLPIALFPARAVA